MFRRHSAAPADEPAHSKTGGAGSPAAVNGDARAGAGRAPKAVAAGKGRPTPKRREAAPRRQPVTAPGNRKQAYRQSRERQRADRARRVEGLKRGDPKYLPAKDRGPVRALARDYVDSRRMLSEYYLYIVAVLFVLFVLPTAAAKLLVYPVFLVTLATISIEGFISARRVRRLAAQRCPGETTRGVAWYAVLRALQLRRLRLPPPRVKRGDTI